MQRDLSKELSTKDIMHRKGCTFQHAARVRKQIREYYGKNNHSPITEGEYVKYFDIKEF